MKKLIIIIITLLLISCQKNVSSTKLNIQNIPLEIFDNLTINNDVEVKEENEENSEVMEQEVYFSKVFVVNGAFVSVYTRPNMTSKSLGYVYQLDEFLIEDTLVEGDVMWYLFDYYGEPAFIRAEGLSQKTRKVTLLIDESEPQQAGIDVSVLNIRDDYNESGHIIGKTYSGESYKILDKKVDDKNRVWYLIEKELGLKGWIAGWYCHEGTYHTFNKLDQFSDDSLSKIGNWFVNRNASTEALVKADPSMVVSESDQDGFNIETNYQFSNGLIYDKDNWSETISCDGGSIRYWHISVVEADIYKTRGDEVIVFLGSEMVIFDENMTYISKHVMDKEYDNIEVIEDEDSIKRVLISNQESSKVYTVKDDQFILDNTLVFKSVLDDMIITTLKDNILVISEKKEELQYTNELPKRAVLMEQVVEKQEDLLIIEDVLNYVQGQLFLERQIWLPISYPIYYETNDYTDFRTSRKTKIATVYYLVDDNLKLTYDHISFKYVETTIERALFEFEEIKIYEEGLEVFNTTNGLERIDLLFGPLKSSVEEDFELYTFRNNDFTFSLYEGMAYYKQLELLSDKYTTLRGLQVGLTEDVVLHLFGTPDVIEEDVLIYYSWTEKWLRLDSGILSFSHIKIYIKDGMVSSIEIRSESEGD